MAEPNYYDITRLHVAIVETPVVAVASLFVETAVATFIIALVPHSIIILHLLILVYLIVVSEHLAATALNLAPLALEGSPGNCYIQHNTALSRKAVLPELIQCLQSLP
jgi:hypothetical protein